MYLMRFIKNFTKHFTIVNIITALIALSVGTLIRNSEIPVIIFKFILTQLNYIYLYLYDIIVVLINKN